MKTIPVAQSSPLLDSLLLVSSLWFQAAVVTRAAPAPVTSTISAATVYADRAVVTRTAALDLAAGEHELVFDNLPTALMDDSLQVSARGVARATILDVNARTTFVAAQPDDRIKGLEDKLKALALERRKLDDSATLLTQRRDYVLKIQAATTTVPIGEKETASTRPSVDDWMKLLAFSDENLAKITEGQQTIDAQRQDLQDQQTALEQQLNELRNGGPADALAGDGGPRPGRSRNVKTVTVHVAVTEPGTLQLALAYAVRGAA